MELIIAPGILFLDEPTTGLDASTATSVIRLLKEYDPVTLILVIPFIQLESTRSNYYPIRSSAKIFYLQII